MQPQNVAQEVVPVFFVRIENVRPLGKQPVYNMEVDKYHNFSVNGGIIVHNCMDACRYFVKTMHLVKRSNDKPYTPLWG